MDLAFLVIAILSLVTGILGAAAGVEIVARWIGRFVPRLLVLRDSLLRITKISQYQLTLLSLIAGLAGLGVGIYAILALASSEEAAGTGVAPTETAFVSTSATLTPRPTNDGAASSEGKLSGQWYSHDRSYAPNTFYPSSTGTWYRFTFEEANDGGERYSWKKSASGLPLNPPEQLGEGTATLDGASLHMEGLVTSGPFEADLELLEDDTVMTGEIKYYRQDGTSSDRIVTLTFRK